MKNMLELPKKSDYHQTTIVDLNPLYAQGEILKKDDTIKYRRGMINLRSVIDVFENETPITILDENKHKAYIEEMEDWIAKNGIQDGIFYGGLPIDNINQLPQMPITNGMPKVPTKKMLVKTTNVLYVNGVHRAMVDDFDEFQEVYFNYLQRQKLDIG
jgi:hypothetical protein